jgi:hypothetical protein
MFIRKGLCRFVYIIQTRIHYTSYLSVYESPLGQLVYTHQSTDLTHVSVYESVYCIRNYSSTSLLLYKSPLIRGSAPPKTHHNENRHIDIQHNDSPNKDTQNNNTKHNEIKHNNVQHADISITTFSITTFRITTLCITKIGKFTFSIMTISMATFRITIRHSA